MQQRPALDVQQMPVTERTIAAQRAPVRLCQRAQSETQRCGSVVRILVRGGASHLETAFHRDACAEQQQVALEGAEIENALQALKGHTWFRVERPERCRFSWCVRLFADPHQRAVNALEGFGKRRGLHFLHGKGTHGFTFTWGKNCPEELGVNLLGAESISTRIGNVPRAASAAMGKFSDDMKAGAVVGRSSMGIAVSPM